MKLALLLALIRTQFAQSDGQCSCSEPSYPATIVAHGDNELDLYLSQDQCRTFTLIASEDHWPTPVSKSFDATSRTCLKAVVKDKGVVGGFISTLEINGVKYSTGNNGLWETQSRNLIYNDKTDNPWCSYRRAVCDSTEIADDAKFMWNGETHNEMDFLLDFGNILDATICADSDNEYAYVELTHDPRGINNKNDGFYMYQDYNNPQENWALSANLDAQRYAFQAGKISSVSITFDGQCESNECDAYFAISIGDNEYWLSFVTDLDGFYDINLGDGAQRSGIFVFPESGANSIVSGDASTLIPTGSDFTRPKLRDALSLGNDDNFDRISANPNGHVGPITLELINNDIDNTFTFKFITPTFPDGISSTYNSAVPTGKDLSVYLMPDGGKEKIRICDVQISSYVYVLSFIYPYFSKNSCFYDFISSLCHIDIKQD